MDKLDVHKLVTDLNGSTPSKIRSACSLLGNTSDLVVVDQLISYVEKSLATSRKRYPGHLENSELALISIKRIYDSLDETCYWSEHRGLQLKKLDALRSSNAYVEQLKRSVEYVLQSEVKRAGSDRHNPPNPENSKVPGTES